jgi:hypothetical protein
MKIMKIIIMDIIYIKNSRPIMRHVIRDKRKEEENKQKKINQK